MVIRVIGKIRKKYVGEESNFGIFIFFPKHQMKIIYNAFFFFCHLP
jgi:hypothetical protein